MNISSPIEIEKFDIDFISLEEIKNYLRIEHNEDDDLLLSLINAATESAENFLRMHIFRKSIEISINGNLNQDFALDIYPINEIVELKSWKGEIEFILQESEDFSFDIFSSKIILKKHHNSDKAKLRLIVGFGRKLPRSIKQGIMKHVQKIYDDKSLEEVFSEVVPFYQTHRRYFI